MKRMTNLEAYRKVRKVAVKQGSVIRPDKGGGYRRKPKHPKRAELGD